MEPWLGGLERWPTPHELHVFLTLAEHLHFGRTARRLGLAQSSLSEAIRRLEAKLDRVLFERTSRRVELTDAGQRLLPAARDVLSALAIATAPPPEPEEHESAPFRIGVEVPGLAEMTGPVLSGFRARHPEARLVLREFSCAHGFFELQLDAALVRTPVHDERLEVHPIATEPRVYFVPLDHPVAGADRLSMLDLQDEPFVVLEDRAPVARDYWAGVEQRDGELPRRVGARAFTARELLDGVVYLGGLTIGLATARRRNLGVAVVDALDLPDNVIALVVRADDPRPIVRDFVEVVPQLVAEHADLAPCITPLGAPLDAGAILLQPS